MQQSFGDIKELVDRVHSQQTANEEANENGSGMVRNLFAGRRNSRKTVTQQQQVLYQYQDPFYLIFRFGHNHLVQMI